MILVSKADFFMKNKQKQAVNSRKNEGIWSFLKFYDWFLDLRVLLY